jgi:TfoX/Sxy family transcriptional regulator of competence genes
MPYDKEIEERMDKAISRWKGISRKKMFGGVCYLLNGNMMGGVHKNDMILRLGEEAAERALQKKHVKPFDITGKAMKGWVMVEKKGFKTEDALKAWLNQAKQFTRRLPPK